MEERRIVHRDLAARNVLVDERKPHPSAPVLEVKIADFGLAKLLQSSQPALLAHSKSKFLGLGSQIGLYHRLLFQKSTPTFL